MAYQPPKSPEQYDAFVQAQLPEENPTPVVGGFESNDDGLYSGSVSIESQKQRFRLGVGNQVVIVDAIDKSYRLWVGHTNPALAPFSVSKNGDVVATSLSLSRESPGNFGDGSDGTITFDGTNTYSFASKSGSTYTLTRDIQGRAITVSAGVILITSGYATWATIGVINNGTIHNNAGDAGNGTDGTGAPAGGAGGTAGAAAPGGTFSAGTAGKAGAAGKADSSAPGDNGVAGTSKTTVLGPAGAAGGNGGSSSTQTGGTGGAAGTVTAETVSIVQGNPSILPLIIAVGVTTGNVFRMFAKSSTNGYTLSTGAGSGSGASGGAVNSGGSGGGGGSGGSAGVVYIASPTITIGAAGSITANGGRGGNAGSAFNASGGGSGGGGGGSGGVIILVYNTNGYTNSGTVQAVGGAGGTKTSGFGGTPTDGTAGNSGSIYRVVIS